MLYIHKHMCIHAHSYRHMCVKDINRKYISTLTRQMYVWNYRIYISQIAFSQVISPVQFSSVQLLSSVQLCSPMDCSTPGFPVHHQHPELTQTHVHKVSDAIQLSHPLSSPSPPAFSLSQHQGLFQWVSSSHLHIQYCTSKVLEFRLLHQSFQWIFRTDFL